MKRLILILALVAFSNAMIAVVIKAPNFIPMIENESPVIIDTISLTKLGLFGSVKSVTEITYIVRNDEDSIEFVRPVHFTSKVSDDNEGIFESDEKFKETNFKATFNPNGSINEYILLWPDLETKELNKYYYSPSNQLIKQSQYIYLSDDTILNIYTYSYNTTTNKVIHIERIHDGYSAHKTSIEYNNQGELEKITLTNSNGDDESKIYHYNDCGITYFNDTEYNTSVSYIYNSNCQIIEEHSTWGEELNFTTIYEYNNSNISSIKSFQNDKLSYSKKFTYSNGRLKSVQYSETNQNFNYTENYEYIDSTVIISRINTKKVNKVKYENDRIIFIDKNNDTYLYDYQLDSHGNWTKVIEYKNGVARYGRKRTIKYY